MKIKVGVIYGGETVEHEVSIISAVQAMEYLDPEKYDIIPIYISKDRIWYSGQMLKDISVYKDFDNLKRYAKKVVLVKKDKEFVLKTMGLFSRTITNIDIILPVVHGNNIEDGTIQGYLDTLGIPYVGSHVLGAAVAQDKVVMKQIMANEGLPIVDYTWFYDCDYLVNSKKVLDSIKKLGYPVIVKPASLGSSVGISVVKDESKIDDAISEAMKYDVKVVVEKVVDNLIEINASVLGNYEYQEVSVLERVTGNDEILSYEDKYYSNGKKGKFGSKGMASLGKELPAKISKELEKEIKNLAKKTFMVLNLSGVVRIDFLVDKKTNKVYVNEPNTSPGSLSFYLWEPIGKPYKVLLDDLISLAIKDYKNRQTKIYSFDSNILSYYGGVKGFKGMKK